ncbi:hypothetical protein F5Y09DRAFT_341757 [Xylaria sp. FL1042]|nr:hypothetical protein F5Y09DRAFT_341757 [Xylaria sp. FL1042]
MPLSQRLRAVTRLWNNIRKIQLIEDMAILQHDRFKFALCRLQQISYLVVTHVITSKSLTIGLSGLEVNALDFASPNQGFVPTLTMKALFLRTILSIRWIWNTYVILVIFHDILAIIFVSILLWDLPEEWPCLFGSLSEAYTLKRFWGVFWHRIHIAPFQLLMPSFMIPRNQKAPQQGKGNHAMLDAGFQYKTFRAFWMFFLSAICHIATNFITIGNGNAVSELRFFLSNFCICLAETCVANMLLGRSPCSGTIATWKRWLGYTTALREALLMMDKCKAEDSDEGSSMPDSTMSLAYCPFPPVMKVYYQWNLAGLYKFHVCGTNQEDRLFAVKVHTGYLMKEPLREKQGLFIYNGPTTDHPLLAAVGDDSVILRTFPINNNSRIFLPGMKSSALTKEMMRGYITPDKHVGFRFSIEVGTGLKLHRQEFVWKNINKSERDDGAEHGGFKLFFLSSDHEQNTANGESSKQGASTSSATVSEDEALAIFEWRQFLKSPKHPFDLKLVGAGLSGKLGERWVLMVLITALRLWELHARGKSQKGSVAVAGIIGPKEKAGPKPTEKVSEE